MALRRFQNLEAENRKSSSAMLFAGAMFGLIGFILALAVGIYTYRSPELDANANHNFSWKSNHGYFAASVSEMVHDPHSAAGKCFFAFEFIGAMLVFFSWYPFKLRRVFFGDDETVCMTGVSWPMFRQFVPTLGWMLFATVTTTPMSEAFVSYAEHDDDHYSIEDRGKQLISFGYQTIPTLINRAGLWMFFAGYAVAEAKVLGVLGFEQPRTMMSMIPNERWWRRFWLLWLIFACLVELMLQVVLSQPKYLLDDIGLCCKEEWVAVDNKWKLKDTAHQRYLWLKMTHYGSELVMGLSLIFSLLGVWYFCDERHADLEENLRRMIPSQLDSFAIGIELQPRVEVPPDARLTSSSLNRSSLGFLSQGLSSTWLSSDRSPT